MTPLSAGGLCDAVTHTPTHAPPRAALRAAISRPHRNRVEGSMSAVARKPAVP